MPGIDDPGSPDGATESGSGRPDDKLCVIRERPFPDCAEFIIGPAGAGPGGSIRATGRPKAQDPPEGGSFLEQASVAGPHTMRVGPVHPSPAAIATIGGVEAKTGTAPPSPSAATEASMPAASKMPTTKMSTTKSVSTTTAVPRRCCTGNGDCDGHR
jgi:hypothetical protein